CRIRCCGCSTLRQEHPPGAAVRRKARESLARQGLEHARLEASQGARDVRRHGQQHDRQGPDPRTEVTGDVEACTARLSRACTRGFSERARVAFRNVHGCTILATKFQRITANRDRCSAKASCSTVVNRGITRWSSVRRSADAATTHCGGGRRDARSTTGIRIFGTNRPGSENEGTIMNANRFAGLVGASMLFVCATSAAAALSANVSIITTKDDIFPVSPGDSVAYTITVTNNGPDPAIAVSVADNTLDLDFVSNTGDCTGPYPCSLGTLAASDSKVIHSTYTLPSDWTPPNPALQTVTVSSSTPDPFTSDNTAFVYADVAGQNCGNFAVSGGNVHTCAIVAGNG